MKVFLLLLLSLLLLSSLAKEQEKKLRSSSRSRRATIVDRHWCRDAVCQNSRFCSPCDRRFLFLFATGRSGSTTLTYMLDSLPGIRMAGENNNTLGHLFDTIRNVRENPSWIGGAGHRGAWGHNAVPDGAFGCAAQAMVETINPPDEDAYDDEEPEMILGFKSIRFVDGPTERDQDMASFVKEMFPCSRVVLNIRGDLEAEKNSYETNHWGATSIERLELTNHRMRALNDYFGEQAMLLDSSAWANTDDPNHLDSLNELVQWLGYSENCVFTELLQYSTEGYNGDLEPLDMGPGCYYAGDFE